MNLKLTFSVCTIALFSFNNSFAQREKSKCISTPVIANNIKLPTDTLQPASFITGTPTLYKYIQGGYSFGTNKLGDHAFAQVYKVTTSYLVDGIALWVGAKKQIGTADTLNVLVYNLNGPGTDSSGAANNAPGTVSKTIKIALNQIDTTSLTFITFPDSFIVYVDYAVGVDFSQIADDTLGLVTTTDGDAQGTELSWNKYSDNNWHTILEPSNWGMDLDLGIFIIADKSSANVNDNYFIDGIKLSQNQPNPASDATLVQYEIQNSGNVILEIYDMAGKLILSYDEGKQTAGRHSILIDSEKLRNGIYYYSLKTGKHRLTKKMLITK
ncbi:MAG: T9SS type A sorting domain-containing protein [Bacteroidales bacterium]